jgi:hypothetical protein
MSTSRVMLRAMVFSLAGMVVVYYGIGYLLADEWQVDTVRTIGAPPDRVASTVKDFATWAKWSSMDSNLGPETVREVSGAAGVVGHRITWSGGRGKAMLTSTAMGADFVEYEFRVEGPSHEQAHWQAAGRVEWAPEGGGCRVRWQDRSHWDSLAGRWFAWFGAPQERMRQIQGTSLAGLEEFLAGPERQPPPK